jgi:hypothetical protein
VTRFILDYSFVETREMNYPASIDDADASDKVVETGKVPP